MTRPRLAAAALLLLADCPLPQSVPSVPPGSVTPPRIVEDSTLTPCAATIAFDPSCPTAQSFRVTATVADENFSEAVEYRWFVDYDPTSQPRWTPLARGSLEPPVADPFTLRPVPNFVIYPAQFAPPAVLELVVSNGFEVCPPDPGSPQPVPCRTPQTTPQNSYEARVGGRPCGWRVREVARIEAGILVLARTWVRPSSPRKTALLIGRSTIARAATSARRPSPASASVSRARVFSSARVTGIFPRPGVVALGPPAIGFDA